MTPKKEGMEEMNKTIEEKIDQIQEIIKQIPLEELEKVGLVFSVNIPDPSAPRQNHLICSIIGSRENIMKLFIGIMLEDENLRDVIISATVNAHLNKAIDELQKYDLKKGKESKN